MRSLCLAALVLMSLSASPIHAQSGGVAVEPQPETVRAETSPPGVAVEGPSAVQILPPEEIKEPRGAAPSFQRRSGTRAGGPANELNTGDERAAVQLPRGSAADAVTGRDLYHGNYCGVGNAGPGAPPVDELDAICKRHDECYDSAGHRSCNCDAQLRQDALDVAELKRLPREVRARAAAVAEAATVMECQNP